MSDFTFTTWNEWLAVKTAGRKWIVARALTDKMRGQGYEQAITRRQWEAWEEEYRAEREEAALRAGPWYVVATDTADAGGPAIAMHSDGISRMIIDRPTKEGPTSPQAQARDIVRILNLQWAGLYKRVDTFGR